MHKPALLPDELVGGYLGRLAQLNGMACGATALAALYADTARPRGRTACPTPFELIAQIAQVDKAYLLRAHTLLPLDQLVIPGRAAVDRAAAGSRAAERRRRADALDIGLWQCPHCIREDIQFWGFAYARRSTQLPGLDWCTKHGVLLMRTSQTDKIVDAVPIAPMAAELRYVEILDALLHLPYAVPLVQAAARLRQRAVGVGLRTRRSSGGETMSDRAASVMPARWLQRHRPLIAAGVRADRLDSVHTSAPRRFAADDYVLALTVLYESADEALLEFLRPLSSVELARVESLARRRGPKCRRGLGAAALSSELPETSRQ